MEAVAIMNCRSLLGHKRPGFVTGHRKGALSLPEKSGLVCMRGGEFSFRLPSLEWRTLHLRSPHCSRASRQRVSSLGQQAIASVDSTVGDKKALFIEEEQKLLLKREADSVVNDLRGACIFLVGMMGSGKTTVGKYVAEALGYIFFDSDRLVEDAAGGVTVAQMFREGKEDEFRNAETETLMQLSSRGRLVVATGGGAVIRPQNWGYLRHGITVWLDVPVEDLARRVVAVGCESRPLLGQQRGQMSPEAAYNEALNCLSSLYEDREGYYKNADAVVSVAGLPAVTGVKDVSSVTPTMLAVQVLREIAVLIEERKSMV